MNYETEPVLISALVKAGLEVLGAFGLIFSDQQAAAIVAFAVALVTVIVAFITRETVVPVGRAQAQAQQAFHDGLRTAMGPTAAVSPVGPAPAAHASGKAKGS